MSSCTEAALVGALGCEPERLCHLQAAFIRRASWCEGLGSSYARCCPAAIAMLLRVLTRRHQLQLCT
jgi:hypothetical protein